MGESTRSDLIVESGRECLDQHRLDVCPALQTFGSPGRCEHRGAHAVQGSREDQRGQVAVHAQSQVDAFDGVWAGAVLQVGSCGHERRIDGLYFAMADAADLAGVDLYQDILGEVEADVPS